MAAHNSAYSVIFTFGKHAGRTLGSVYDSDRKYLEWMSGADGVDDNWRVACATVLLGNSVENLSLPRVSQAGKSAQELDFGFTLREPAKIMHLTTKKSAVKFGYNPRVLNRFKDEIDGRTWNGDEKYWEVPIVQLPKVIKLFGGPKNVIVDDRVKKLVVQEVNRRKDLDEIRAKEDSDYEIPGLLIPARPYQVVGVEFIERAGGRALVADEVGLGKTLVAIAYAIKNKCKTLVVCPAAVKINWVREIDKFTGKKCCVWDSKGTEGHGNSQFHIINYDSLAKQVLKLNKIDFDLLVCDEVTHIKNKKTLRAKAVFGDGRAKKKSPGIKTKDVIFLTATPVLNRPIEIFTFLNFLSKDRFPNFYAFTKRYGGWRGAPVVNLLDLHERTKDLTIRRTQKDVKLEMPEVQRSDIFCELSKQDEREYNDLLRKLFRDWKSAKPTIGTMPAIDRFLIERKMPNAIQIIEEFIEAGRGVVVFSKYKAPLKKLNEHFGKISGQINGEMKLADRQVVIDGIRNKLLKLALVTLGAGKMGIDGLQFGASIVIFLDQDWVPAWHHQAEGRVARSGQTEPVQIYYLLCNAITDEVLGEILKEKQLTADTIVDGSVLRQEKEKSVFKEFVRRLQLKTLQDFSFELEG